MRLCVDGDLTLSMTLLQFTQVLSTLVLDDGIFFRILEIHIYYEIVKFVCFGNTFGCLHY